MSRNRTLPAGLVLSISLLFFPLTLAPAAGQIITRGQEQSIGAQEHPKIIQQFGGAYDEAKVSGYAATIGGRIVANSEQPKAQYRFTVLDSPTVNAFALPGGYVYVTRGLVALANSEAELASVLAHEVGHVTARHSARRNNQSMGLALGSAVLGALIGNPMVSNVINQGSQLYLLGYSRDQEYEADRLGIRYMVNAGYDPYAGADFLRNMERQDALESQLAPAGGQGRPVEFLSTHPQTAKRVEEAIAAARTTGVQIAAKPRRRDEFLAAIDGMVFGDSPEHGFVRERMFTHPQMRFTFTVPPGFRLVNQPDAVIAQGPEGMAIKFDMAPLQQPMAMPSYLTQWAKGASLRSPESLVINGMQAATAVTTVSGQNGVQANMRLVAIAFQPNTVARFMILMPKKPSAQMTQELQRFTYSFRGLSASEAASFRPQRIKIVRTKPGETIASLAERMPFPDHREARFRTLNGLAPETVLAPGTAVKMVVE